MVYLYQKSSHEKLLFHIFMAHCEENCLTATIIIGYCIVGAID